MFNTLSALFGFQKVGYQLNARGNEAYKLCSYVGKWSI